MPSSRSKRGIVSYEAAYSFFVTPLWGGKSFTGLKSAKFRCGEEVSLGDLTDIAKNDVSLEMLTYFFILMKTSSMVGRQADRTETEEGVEVVHV